MAQVRHMVATFIRNVKPTDAAFPRYLALLERMKAEGNQAAIGELVALHTGSSTAQWDTFYDRWSNMRNEITVHCCMQVVRDMHLDKAKEGGSYHEAVTDGTGVPFLQWCVQPPYPREDEGVGGSRLASTSAAGTSKKATASNKRQAGSKKKRAE
jgi:hypothetical protein